MVGNGFQSALAELWLAQDFPDFPHYQRFRVKKV
jgi:hypothetical protein